MKKYLCYLPHVVVAVIVLMSAFGKISGADMSVELFNQLNMFGMPDESRMVLGIAQVLLVTMLFCKKTEKIASALLLANMIGALILVGFNILALIVAILSLVIYLRSCEGVCDSKSCKNCCFGK